MSLNDFKNEGIYIWASTGINMYPWAGGIGNANWAPTQPDNATPDEDCVTMNNGNTGWDDNSCTALYNANFSLNSSLVTLTAMRTASVPKLAATF